MSGLVALDLFAGTGWGVALQELGIREIGVENMPEAVETRRMHGMETIDGDVWDVLAKPPVDVEQARFHIASPPCQSFSVAGKGAGRKALDDVLRAITERKFEDLVELREFADSLGDERIGLVLTPLHAAVTFRPDYILWEQVPPVLSVWEACAEVLRWRGYSVTTGLIHAEQYGVPQTRKRAILMASRVGEVAFPAPTHSRYYSRSPEKLDPSVRKWVSMAEALGWGPDGRPSPTVTGGGAATGGAEPFGRWGRRIIQEAAGE